jgi:hypothetical protein
LALVACIVYVPVAAKRNGQLRRELAANAGAAGDARTLAVTLRRNIALSALEGAALPEPIAGDLRASVSAHLGPNAAGLLVMIYTPMTCERSRRAGLQSLTKDRQALTQQGVVPTVVVAERGSADREGALLLRAEGLLSFPITFMPADTLIGTLFPNSDDTFDEEPIYLRLDRQLRVQSAFHADQRRPELLDLWLGQSHDATQLRLSQQSAGGGNARADRNQRSVIVRQARGAVPDSRRGILLARMGAALQRGAPARPPASPVGAAPPPYW